MIARAFNSGFALSDETFNGMACASDGQIYYALSSKSIDVGAQLYAYDPVGDRIRHLGDLTAAAGEAGRRAIPQGKVHVGLVEADGRLYFATHLDTYEVRDGRETFSEVPPPGYGPYPGGHFLSYDLASGGFEDLGVPRSGEGILTMAMDALRGRLYGLTWPSGRLVWRDLAAGDWRDLGPVQAGGEVWPAVGSTYRAICRSLAVDPRDGSVYFTRADGPILRCRPDGGAVETVAGVDLRRDYFGSYDPSAPGAMGYNWRQTVWYPPEEVFYGMHGNSGYLFRFDPRTSELDVIERLTSRPSRRTGMFDQFTYGYLGFALGGDGHTLCYLTGGPIFEGGKRVAGDAGIKFGSRGRENFHLVTYDLRAARYADHGPIFLPDGQRPAEIDAIAVGRDGRIYTLARFAEDGRARTDLIRIEVPEFG